MPADANVCFKCGYNFNVGPYVQPPPQGQANPNWQAYPRGGPNAPAGTHDGLGIASLVCGLVSIPTFCAWCLGPPLALLALILGAFALRGRNRALAIAGMICGGISLLMFAGVMILGLSLGLAGSSGRGPFR